MSLAGLDLAGRAALVGVTCREYVALAELDMRIVADAALATPHAVRRLRAWIAAGKPDVAADGVLFHIDASVHAILVATLAGIPMPARWHATRHVTWFEIGRGSPAGYMTAFDPRRLDGDLPHVIVLDGRMPDELLPPIIAHELGHAIHCAWRTSADHAQIPATELESDARLLAALDSDRDAAARMLFHGEHLANEAARLWGHPCTGLCPDAVRLRRFRERMDVAANLAANISRETDADLAARAAATEGAP